VVAASTHTNLQSYLATLASQEPTERVRVIVQLAMNPIAGEQLIVQAGGQVEQQLALINALVAEMPAGALPRLAQAPGVKQISLDAPVTKLSEGGDGLIDVRDTFDQVAYGNNDGESFWTDAWQEVGEDDGPQDGDVAVLPFWGGALQVLRLQGGDRGAQRQVDLSQASGATVSLSYRRKDFSGETDVATLAVSTDGGAAWQAVGQLTGPATDAEIQYAHYDLSAFVGKPVQIRLQLASTMSADAKFYLDAINLQWTPTADATVALVRRAYLPLVANPAATVATEAGDGTVQAAVYSTAALASTYVRAIARDLGRLLGCFGHVTGLRRTRVGPFTEEDAVPLAELDCEGALPFEDLLSVEAGLSEVACVVVDRVGAARLRRARRAASTAPDTPATSTGSVRR
jgi:hypothetical protein